MTIIDLKTMREASPPPFSVLCLGNFDGVHFGHIALVKEAVDQCEKKCSEYDGIVSGACFFRTPPSNYFLSAPIPQLTTFEQKLHLFADCGLEMAFVMDFEEVGGLSPEQFVKQVLAETCHCVFAVCGFDFRFGKNAVGTADTLKTLMCGAASIIPPICRENQVVSSSAIRQRIADGEMHLVPALLGRPFCLYAEVLHGKALGRTIGIPTVNQYFPGNLAIPKYGIYITQTVIDGTVYPSVSNVGIRPTVNDGSQINCETHILDFDGDLYGRTVEVRFLKRLRDEMRFHSIDALRAQIHRDILQTREYYKEA